MPIDRSKIDSTPPIYFYIFFLFHMGVFGIVGLYLSYADGGKESVTGLLISLLPMYVYIKFYIGLFGLDDVRWLFINSALGAYGIFAELDFILYLFGATVDDYPGYAHIVPFMYYILYTFLIRHALIDLTPARFDNNKKRLLEKTYVAISIVIYTAISLL